jgi:heavy metal sensor kinase
VINSLKTRIAVWYISLSTLVLVFLGVALYLIISQSMMNERRALVIHDLERFKVVSERLQVRDVAELLEEAEEEIPLKPADEFVQVFTQDGEMVAASSNLRGNKLSFRRSVGQNPASEIDTVPLSNGSDALSGMVQFNLNGVPHVVEIAVSLETLRSIQRRLLITLLLAIPVAIVLSFVGGTLLARHAIGPLQRMTETAHRISADRLEDRISLASADVELKRLADSFNLMLDRLDQSFKQMRQFTADASHELRTPVAILIGESELAVNNLLDHEECKAALSSRREELQRMARIVDDLLTLSKFDFGQQTLLMKRLDLSDLVIEVCEQQRSQAKTKGVELHITNTVPVQIEGDSTRLRQMVRNILDNAIKYTPEGGKVTVSLRRSGGNEIELVVSDNGIGIPASAIPHIFDRFYRVDQARTREQGGSGLGLSIVKQIVEAHGGRITVESKENEGTFIKIVMIN